jgi:O-antigen/teichoic acid export membrane protein
MTIMPDDLSLRARLARAIFWIVWSRGVIQLLNFAVTLAIARILQPSDYGLMAIAGIFTTATGMLVEMGLGAAVVQFRDLDNRELNTCFWITMALASAAYAVLFFSSGIIAEWFAAPRLAELLPVLALVLPVMACSVVSDGLLRKQLALHRISQAEIFASLITTPVTLACALGGLGLWALVVGALLAPAARSVAVLIFSPWRPGLQLGGKRVREVLHFSLANLGVKLLWVMREQADVVIVGKITGDATVGFYSMAKELALLPANKISNAMNMLSSPVMAELQTEVSAMKAAFFRAVRLTAAFAVPTAIGMALTADEIVTTLLGPKWLPAVPVLPLLCAYAAVRAVDVLFPPVLFARRRQGFMFAYALVLVLLVPISAVFGALWDGAKGVVMFSLPVYCAIMGFMAKEALTEMKTGFRELFSKIWPILAAGAAMLPVVILTRQLTGEEGSALMRLILLSASGAATYFTCLAAVGRPIIAESTQILGWILRRGVDG